MEGTDSSTNPSIQENKKSGGKTATSFDPPKEINQIGNISLEILLKFVTKEDLKNYKKDIFQKIENHREIYHDKPKRERQQKRDNLSKKINIFMLFFGSGLLLIIISFLYIANLKYYWVK